MTHRSLLSRLAAWLGITRKPPEHVGYSFDECPACIANRKKEARR